MVRSDLVQAKVIIQLVIIHDFSDSVVSHSENKLKPPALQYFANTLRFPSWYNILILLIYYHIYLTSLNHSLTSHYQWIYLALDYFMFLYSSKQQNF